MEGQLLRRPLIEVLFGRSRCLLSGNAQTKRCESSFRRTKKKLNIKPDSSFLFANKSPQQDHIIFNPPSSAPSLLHTPLKFLPKEDPRRQLFASAATSTLAASSSLPGAKMYNPNYKPGFQRYHLSQSDVEEMRNLRTADPNKWTKHKLAKKYNCTTTFVNICTAAPQEKKDAEWKKVEEIKARWGPKRTRAREDRAARREAVYRDE